VGLAIAFWILAALIVLSAIGVIVQQNVFRAALSLILCLVSIAGIFITLSADFLAAAQVLVYVGAISVVIILAIMLTREFTTGNPSNRWRLPALVISAALCGLISFAVLNTDWKISTVTPQTPTTLRLGEQLFGRNGFILPLEISAVLILAVVIGAIVIAREK
jgi:NADH-quinone oxidoreductase subunit J